MKKIALALVLFVVFTGCKKEEKPLSLSTETINNKSLKACAEGPCPTIEIDKITASEGAFADTINHAVNKHLIGILIIDPDELAAVHTLDKALQNFIEDYRISRSDFPDATPEYEVSSTSTISYENEQLLCIKFEDFTYWGGAHGYGSTSFLNFDKETKSTLSNEALFSDLSGFKKLAETRFRNQQKIPEGESINSTGYFFEEDQFSLPHNIGLTANELILIYNPYEAASYAEGQLVLKFPVSEIKAYLKPSL